MARSFPQLGNQGLNAVDYWSHFNSKCDQSIGEYEGKLHETDSAQAGEKHYRLQHFLGHASITNTVRYTAMSPEPFKDVWR
jgi:hypothetical protein